MARIAMVEDDGTMRSMLTALLEGAGYEVTSFADGRSALERLPAAAPDFVLLDVNLPDMTGQDVCRALKADARTKDVPVMLMTGEARDVEQRVAGLDAGADDYLLKPFNTKVLLARLRQLLKR